MARKTTETTGNAVETTDTVNAVANTGGTNEKKRVRTEKNNSGFYCYIGPSLKKLIQTGTVYRGTQEEALAKAAEAIEAQPLVKTLIVAGDNLPAARNKVKTPGNALYVSYQQLAGKEGK